MISDEMRELLSLYVDGELRDADAARVEQMTAQDAELRREVAAYRVLREKLRAWDDAENGAPAPPEMAERALRRADTFAESERRERRGRLATLLREPLAVAAAVLAAAGLGIALARGGSGGGPVVVAHEPRPAQLPLSAPFPDFAVPAVEVAPPAVPAPAAAEDLSLPEAIDAFANVMVDGVPMSPRAALLREQWMRERREVVVRADPVETQTSSPPQPHVAALVAGYRPAAAEPGLVVLAGAAPVPASPLRAFDAAAMDHATEPGLLVRSDEPRLALAGEVFVAERDGSLRTRVVGADGWVARNAQFLPVVWADRIEVPKDGRNLESQGVVLGPKARRQLLAAKDARDPAFLDWLYRSFQGKGLPEALRNQAARRQKAVDALMRGLRDPSTTGFAVVAGGKVLGVELFLSHEILLECAPRLLHGYLLEAGELDAAAGAVALERAHGLLDELPRRSAAPEDAGGVPRDGWPEGLRCVHLRDGVRRIVGHGLVQDGRPVHVTIFGDE